MNRSFRWAFPLRIKCLMRLMSILIPIAVYNIILTIELTPHSANAFYFYFYFHNATVKVDSDATSPNDAPRPPEIYTRPKDMYPAIHSTDTELYPDIYPNMTQNLVDFAVTGFAKCGTTFLQRKILGASPHIFMGAKDNRGNYEEMHQMAFGNLTGFLAYFQSHNSSTDNKRGFKEPLALMWEPTLYHLSTYFPEIKLIVAIRHPIPWFESLYNYRMRTVDSFSYDFNITPHNRIGECKREIKSKWNVCTSQHQPCITNEPGFGCTDWSNYHVHLSRLGWTPRNSTREMTLLHNRLEQTYNFSQSRMFLMESKQLNSWNNLSRADALIHDLESFLDLDVGSLPTFEQIPNESITREISEQALKRFISICDEEYGDLRQILLQQAVYVMNRIIYVHFFAQAQVYIFYLLFICTEKGGVCMDSRVFLAVTVRFFPY